MGQVSYSVSFARNMGDFESLKISAGFTDEVRPDETDEEAYARVKEFVEPKLMADLAEVEEAIVKMRAEIRAGNGFKKRVKTAAETGK